MANVSVLWRPASDAGTWSGGSWRSTLPLGNLTTQDPQQVARSATAAPSATRFRVDFGAPQLVTQFVLLNHNMTLAGRARFVLTNDAADSGARVYDSDWRPAWEPTVIWGSRPWGTFPWSGVDATAYPAGSLLLHSIPPGQDGRPQAMVARYLWVYLDDAANPAGYVQAGRFMAGWSWSPKVNAAWGAALRIVDPSEVRRTRGGRRIVVSRPKYRTLDLDFAALSEAEALGSAETITRELGKGGEMFVCMDADEDPSVRFRRALYASLVDTAPIVAAAPGIWTWRLSVEEIV